MNFAGVKAISIPEGAVKKIANGENVLWQANTGPGMIPFCLVQPDNEDTIGGYTVYSFMHAAGIVTGEKYIVFVNGAMVERTSGWHKKSANATPFLVSSDEWVGVCGAGNQQLYTSATGSSYTTLSNSADTVFAILDSGAATPTGRYHVRTKNRYGTVVEGYVNASTLYEEFRVDLSQFDLRAYYV